MFSHCESINFPTPSLQEAGHQVTRKTFCLTSLLPQEYLQSHKAAGPPPLSESLPACYAVEQGLGRSMESPAQNVDKSLRHTR